MDRAKNSNSDNRLVTMQPSQIREIHNLGVRLRNENPDRAYFPLHFGEPDLGTPAFIVEAGCQALRNGAVFYENNSGRPDLKDALADHHGLLPEQFVVSCGGTQAIYLSLLALLSPGDDAINITPNWPNFTEAARLCGARVHEVPLQFSENTHRFVLDFECLESAVERAHRLRAIIVNSPSNPTGWVITAKEQEMLLELCRRHDVYLISDEIYDRIVFTGERFASLARFLSEWHKIIIINGFSKTYAMTGWRIGYLITNVELAIGLARMQEFITSHAPSMAQVAAITALKDGEDFVAESLNRYHRLRDRIVPPLESIPEVTIAQPDGTFYVFFSVMGVADSMRFCTELLTEAGVSLAPGNAFGLGGEEWVRMCFANQPEVLESAIDRIQRFLEARA